MSTIIRSILVVAALAGSVSAASAGSYYGHGWGKGHGHGQWKKSHDARAFFDQLKRNSGS